MPHTTSEGPAIYYETSGESSHEPLVLISGAGAQLIWWREAFVQRLVDRGFYVIRLDNRDVGLSDKMGGEQDVGPVYTIDDMADDVRRVLDALGVARAHIVGQSLGGMITQILALNHPERVKSITLFYTIPTFEMQWLGADLLLSLAAPMPDWGAIGREESIAAIVEQERVTGSTLYPFDEEGTREWATRSYDRCFCPSGPRRQAAGASMSFGDRSEGLKKLPMPAAIIHGRVDRLFNVEASFRLGELLGDSELHIYPGMGHEIVEPLWDDFVAIIARTAARAQ